MKFKTLILKIVLVVIPLQSKAQNIDDFYVQNWFDNTLGSENLSINNGKIHTNYDFTLNNESRYFEYKDFVKGNVNYDNQNYYDLNLKYDIYNDELVLNPANENEYIKINLIKENIINFIIQNKKFVQIKSIQLNGFYEESLIGKNFVFYIKHYKEKKEILKDNRAYSSYFYKTRYYLFHDNKYKEIISKKDLIKTYPKNKSQINDFYDSNRNLKKENQLKFMKNLFQYINNF